MYVERSPINKAERIRAGLLMFQGMEDKLSMTDDFYALSMTALESLGGQSGTK